LVYGISVVSIFNLHEQGVHIVGDIITPLRVYYPEPRSDDIVLTAEREGGDCDHTSVYKRIGTHTSVPQNRSANVTTAIDLCVWAAFTALFFALATWTLARRLA
jgi:hypothetical protein